MRTIVVSDMHLGCVASPAITGGARAFEAMLLALASTRTRVVLNGDNFDFLAQELAPAGNAEQVMHAFTEDAGCALLLSALARVLAVGGELVVRAGEHDRALDEPAVRAVMLRALASNDAAPPRVSFHDHRCPTLLEIGGARVVVAHDVYDRDSAADRWLAVQVLNPLRRQYGVGLADLLRPDYASAVAAALVANPTAAKLVLRLADADVWPKLSGSLRGSAMQLPHVFARAGLTPRERAVMTAALDPGVVLGVRPADYRHLEHARLKLLRFVLPRHVTDGEAPRRLGDAEWSATCRLARRFGASAAILGHSRAVGWRSEDGLTALDTGTWAWLLAPPMASDDDGAWRRTLATWQGSPRIDGPRDGLRLRWTAALIEPRPDNAGALLALVEWRQGGGLLRWHERSLPRA